MKNSCPEVDIRPDSSHESDQVGIRGNILDKGCCLFSRAASGQTFASGKAKIYECTLLVRLRKKGIEMALFVHLRVLCFIDY